jgi:DMSO/TMAO reductase YedYZ molybdopterin-dependent catalytic subunit
MHTQVMVVTLECAGNGRSLFDPPVEGEQWALGAVSTAEWRGVRLNAVLDRAGAGKQATHLVFHGADGAFDRGLSLDQARDALLAFDMNGAPLPAAHGGPLRLVVPGWYAVASVKWLASIGVVDSPFTGHFQTDRYVFSESEPVSRMRVRSLITEPEDGSTLAAGEVVIRGLAWSGYGAITEVDVSVDGDEWQPAVVSPAPPHAWHAWSHAIHVDAGTSIAIRSRATDVSGNFQPERAEWNRLGYGNNSIQVVRVRAV